MVPQLQWPIREAGRNPHSSLDPNECNQETLSDRMRARTHDASVYVKCVIS